MYGGTAGQPYDPCYHQACDTFANNNDEVLDLNSDAIAAATLTYAMSTQTINGHPGQGQLQGEAQPAAGRARRLISSVRRRAVPPLPARRPRRR